MNKKIFRSGNRNIGQKNHGVNQSSSNNQWAVSLLTNQDNKGLNTKSFNLMWHMEEKIFIVTVTPIIWGC